MNYEIEYSIKKYLEENFPHLRRVWGMDNLDNFIAERLRKACNLYKTPNDGEANVTSSEEWINIILFERSIKSPFNEVKSILEHHFPCFHKKLVTMKPEIRLNILIDLTIYCSPSEYLSDDLVERNLSTLSENELTLGIARYLHQFW